MTILTIRRTATLLALALLAGCSEGDASEAAAPAAGTASAVVAAAPAGGDIDPAQYRLTMDRVRHWYRVMLEVKKVIDAQPELEDVFAADVDDSLDAYVAKVEAVPALRTAVEGAGMSVREHAVIATVFMEAALLDAGTEMGQDPAGIRAAMTTHPDNAAFLREHAAELQALQTEMAAAAGITDEELEEEGEVEL